MVFESLVVEVLNKFLGAYVENLDANQFKLSVFSGNVELHNLAIKASALDGLDLPVQLAYGYISHIHLEFPWRDLYNKPVIANVEGLHLIVVPNQGAKYDAAKEEKTGQDTKQGELLRLEESRVLKRKQKDAKDEDKQDSFVEKMVTLIIRNLQVTVKNVHIRYEDEYTNKSRPFAGGVTLNQLVFQTVDENWKQTLITAAVKQFNKLIELKSLSIYWNSGTHIFSRGDDRNIIQQQMIDCVADKKHTPKGFSYILEPIELSAQLKMNQDPERDGSNWTIPKIWLNVDIQKLGISIGKFQYQDILEFLEAQERFTLSGKYRKHRPQLKEYRGHGKSWWKFAIACEREKIARKQRNWSWRYIKEHRDLVKKYKDCWIEKLTVKSPTKHTLDTIQVAETKLDVFNINVARQLADMEVDSKGMKRVEDQPTGWLAWMGFGGGAQEPKKDKTGGSIASQFENAMSPEEKSKMFDAIDYQENMPATNFPKTYVERHVIFQLHALAISVLDDIDAGHRKKVVALTLNTIAADIKMRPSAGAVKLIARMETISAEGMPSHEGSKSPVLLSMANHSKNAPPLLAFDFETNPLDDSCDQLIKLDVQPTHIVYHAQSINQMAVVFRPPESVRLKALRAGAMSKFDNARELSTTGLQHAVETRTRLTMDIKINPALIIVPQGGVYTKTANLILLDLGTLCIRTVNMAENSSGTPTFKTQDEKRQYLMDRAYDKFQVELKSLQLLYSGPTENWAEARKKSNTPLHLLQPTGFNLQLHKSSITDVNIPQMKLFGDLPDLVINISDTRLMDVMRLGLSIPTPPPAPVDDKEETELIVPDTSLKMKAKMMSIMEESPDIGEAAEKIEKKQMTNEDQNAQMVSMELSLVLQQVSLNLSRQTGSKVEPYLSIGLHRMGADLQMRTFDMKATAQLGDISVIHHQFESMDGKEKVLHLIENPLRNLDASKPLFSVEFIQANKEGPSFVTQYNNTEQFVNVNFEGLRVNMHREALMEVQQFQIDLMAKMAQVQKEVATELPKLDASKKRPSRLSLASVGSASVEMAKRQFSRANLTSRAQKDAEAQIIKTKVIAKMGAVVVNVGSKNHMVAQLNLSGLDASVVMKVQDLQVEAVIKAVGMNDPVKGARYPKLMSVKGGDEMLRVDFRQFNRSEEERNVMGPHDVDMDIKLHLKQLKFVFLMEWVNRMMCWAQPFQAAAENAAREAKSAAAEKSAQAVEKAKELAPKVRFNINLDAPLIVVPVNSKSEETIYLDMGQLTLINAFSEEGKSQSKMKRGACIDNITLELLDFKLARAILDENGEVEAEVGIIEPLSLNLNVLRNMDYEWYKSQPEMGIHGKLPLIKLGASQEDFKMAMKVLSENMTEGTPPTPPKIAPPIKQANVQSEQQLLSVPSQMTTQQSQVDKRAVSKTSAVKMDIDIDVKGLKASLYEGTSNLNKGLAKRDEAKEFGRLAIVNLVMKGQIKENESGEIKAMIDNFLMTDQRAEAVGIKELMSKKDPKKQLVDVTINNDIKGDTYVDARVNAFRMTFCPEFIAALTSFFVVVPDPGEAPPTPVKKQEITPKPVKSPSQSNAAITPVTPVVENVKKMVIKLLVDDPEIVLVEDAKDPMNTSAAFLRFNICADMETGPSGQIIKASLKDLQLYSTYFNEKKRADWNVQVLEPVSVVFDSVTEKNGDQRVNVYIPKLVLKVSPIIIRLLSNVAASAGNTTPVPQSQRSEEAANAKRRVAFDTKDVDKQNYWFLQSAPPEVAQEAIDEGVVLICTKPKPKQILSAKIGSIELSLQANTSTKAIPLIQLISDLDASVNNWGSQMKAEAKVTLQMVQNPIEVIYFDGGPQAALMNMAVTATDMLQISVSKTTLEVFQQLGTAFERAARRKPPAKTKIHPGKSDFVVVNDSGLPLNIYATDGLKADSPSNSSDLKHGDYLDLECKQMPERTLITDVIKPLMLGVELPTMQNTQREMNVARGETRTFGLPLHSHPGDQWILVAQVQAQDGKKIITLRSLLQVQNHLDTDMDIYYLVDTNMEYCGRVYAKGEQGDIFNIPLPAVYSPSGEFYFKPVSDEYETLDSVIWSNFKQNLVTSQPVKCTHVTENNKAYYIQVCSELVHAHFENTTKKTMQSQCYNIHLRPPVILHNLLPVDIQVITPNEEEVKVEGGRNAALTSVCPGQSSILVKVLDGQKVWQANLAIEQIGQELVSRTFTDCHSFESQRIMDLGLRCTSEEGGQNLSLYAPYWLVNNTGKHITFRDPNVSPVVSGAAGCFCNGKTASDEKGDVGEVELSTKDDDLVMFSFQGKEFFQSNKAVMRVEDSDWSDKFPMDTVGSSGRVTCKVPQKDDIDISLTVTLANSGLTKICAMNPFFMVYNTSKTDIQVKQVGQNDSWTNIYAGKCMGFWPTNTNKKEKRMIQVRYVNCEQISQAFPFEETFEGLATIPGEKVGVFVEVSVGEGSVVVKVEDYQQGMAPALIINDSKLPVRYVQTGSSNKVELPPGKARLFTWSDLSQSSKQLEWAVGDDGDKENLLLDTVKELKNGIYLVSLLNARQRTLLFTQNLEAVEHANNTYKDERINSEIDLNLEGIGVSLINNEISLEVAYISMTSSGVVWEVRKNKHKFKALTVKENLGLEEAYQIYVAEKTLDPNVSSTIQIDKLLVDFDLMHLKSRQSKDIRRTFQPGFWMQLKTSNRQKFIHFKLNKLQIDNQLPGSIFPQVVANVPQSASVAADSVPKPLIELSLVQNTLHGNEQIIKYFKILTQEIDVKADKGFINAMLSLIPAGAKEAYGPELFEKDCELASRELNLYATTVADSQAKMYYDYFHISPLMIHLSFSQGGSDGHNEKEEQAVEIQSEFLNLFMKSVGVTLTEIQDVVLKLAYFERQNAFLNQSQLMGEITSHYVKQALKQLYVLVLGLDVLGNPFGLIRDLSSGVEDLFYEPFQGAIQGPEEFAEGLALGMRSLFGHTVGGVAGAATRITGTVGKGVAALTLDDDYQRKRQMAMNRKPVTVTEGMARGGKSLVMGVVDGISGVVTQPIKGAQQGGALGLFKGLGKGVVGVVTRPVSGAVDGTSTIINSVKMATDTTQAVKRIRQPRFIKQDRIIRPYRAEQAEGRKLLMEADKGKFMVTDAYEFHVYIDDKKKYVLILTDQRVMVIHKQDLLGSWEVEWSYVWSELEKCPTISKEGLRIETRTTRTRYFGLGKSSVGKLVKFLNQCDSQKTMAKVLEIYEST